MGNLVIQRGDIYYADLSPAIGLETGGIRPVVVIQNEVSNKYSPTVIVAAVTSMIERAKLPMHVEISAKDYALDKDSVILLEQIKTIDKRRLKKKIGHIKEEDINKIDEALSISVQLRNKIEGIKKRNKEIEEINSAISILKNIAFKYNIEEKNEEKYFDKEYKNLSVEYLQLLESMRNEFNGLSDNVREMNIKIKPLVEKQKQAKGKLNEFAVIDFFKLNGYNAEKASNELDHLKIDVIAKNDEEVIFIQAKNGQVSNAEIGKLVQNIKELKYESNLKKVAGICALRFQPDSDIFRRQLEEYYKIPILFIHKYQILKACPQYKSTIG